MKPFLATVVAALALARLVAHAAPSSDGFRPLFNGRDLTGWDGNPELWTVQDGCITAQTTGPSHLRYNQFLIWRGGTVKNFEFRAKIKVSGNNSGIQYRSRELPAVGRWSVSGYQCDVHPNPVNNAMLYEERGRGVIAQNGERVVADPKGTLWQLSAWEPNALDVSTWHEYVVIARGNHLIHQIDGRVVVEFWDFDEQARALSGVLALQVHRGVASRAQFRDIRIKELPDGDVPPFTPSRVPPEAKPLGKRAPNPRPASEEHRSPLPKVVSTSTDHRPISSEFNPVTALRTRQISR